MPIDKAKLQAIESSHEAEKGRTIMVVDDEPLIVESMAMMLEDEYEVVQADCGETALNLLQSGDVVDRVCMIISDQRMPGMSGVEFLREVSTRFPQVIRMIVSGHMDFPELVSAINESHIHFFMAKPVHYNEILETIRKGVELYEKGLPPSRRDVEPGNSQDPT